MTSYCIRLNSSFSKVYEGRKYAFERARTEPCRMRRKKVYLSKRDFSWKIHSSEFKSQFQFFITRLELFSSCPTEILRLSRCCISWLILVYAHPLSPNLKINLASPQSTPLSFIISTPVASITLSHSIACRWINKQISSSFLRSFSFLFSWTLPTLNDLIIITRALSLPPFAVCWVFLVRRLFCL